MKRSYLIIFIVLSGCLSWHTQSSNKPKVNVLKFDYRDDKVHFYLNSYDYGSGLAGFKSALSSIESLPEGDALLVCGDKLSRFGIFPYFAYAWENSQLSYDEDYAKFMAEYYDSSDSLILNAEWDNPENPFNNACKKLDVIWASDLKINQNQVAILKWKYCDGDILSGVEYFLNGVSCGRDTSGWDIVLDKLNKDTNIKGVILIAPKINRLPVGSESLLSFADDIVKIYNQKPWSGSDEDVAAFKILLSSRTIHIVGALNTSMFSDECATGTLKSSPPPTQSTKRTRHDPELT